MSFKKNFIKICNEQGVSPSKVVEAVGLKRSAYSQWTDESVPRQATLMRIADYFGVTVDYLLGKEAQKEKPGGIPAELWNTLSADPQKMHLAILISKMSHEQLVRIEKLLDAALLLPPE